MAILFAASSRNKLPLSRYADAVLRIAHRWPRLEIVADGARVSPSIFAEGEYSYCVIALHAGSGVVSLRGKAAVACLTPATCLGSTELMSSVFKLELRTSDEGMEAETDHAASIPLFISCKDGLIGGGSWGDLLGSMEGEPRATPPSKITYVKGGVIEFREQQPPRRVAPDSLRDRIEELAGMIELSIRRNVSRRCCVLFSGGLDSSLLAHACQNIGRHPLALTIGLRGSHDIGTARRAAMETGLDHLVVELTKEEVMKSAVYLRKCISLSSSMDLALALLVFIAAMTASSLGRRQLVAGQGADELFGGYAKYQSALRMYGPETTEQQLIRDVESLWHSSIPRDYASSALGGCLLTLPYLDREVIAYSAALPLSEKLAESERKIILRRVATRLGLPPSIAERPKKAAQYGTGLQRAIKELRVVR